MGVRVQVTGPCPAGETVLRPAQLLLNQESHSACVRWGNLYVLGACVLGSLSPSTGQNLSPCPHLVHVWVAMGSPRGALRCLGA